MERTEGKLYADDTAIYAGTPDNCLRMVGDTDTSRLDPSCDRTPEDRANAAFIVTAWNSHASLLAERDAMMAALERVRAGLVSMEKHLDDQGTMAEGHRMDAMSVIDAALALSKPEGA